MAPRIWFDPDLVAMNAVQLLSELGEFSRAGSQLRQAHRSESKVSIDLTESEERTAENK